jgi:hypothetical protein
MVLEFELSTMPSAIFAFSYFSDSISYFLPGTSLRPQSFYFTFWEPGITGMSHLTQLLLLFLYFVLFSLVVLGG